MKRFDTICCSRFQCKQCAFQISLILEEVGDLYKTHPVSTRREYEYEKFINLIKKVLDNLTTRDAAVRLNGIKLLEIISEDQPRPFQSVLFVLFSIIQV
jgi:hypothetical protein